MVVYSLPPTLWQAEWPPFVCSKSQSLRHLSPPYLPGIHSPAVHLRLVSHLRGKLTSPSRSHIAACFVAPSLLLLSHSRHQQFPSSASPFFPTDGWPWLWKLALKLCCACPAGLRSAIAGTWMKLGQRRLCLSDRYSAPACLIDVSEASIDAK